MYNFLILNVCSADIFHMEKGITVVLKSIFIVSCSFSSWKMKLMFIVICKGKTGMSSVLFISPTTNEQNTCLHTCHTYCWLLYYILDEKKNMFKIFHCYFSWRQSPCSALPSGGQACKFTLINHIIIDNGDISLMQNYADAVTNRSWRNFVICIVILFSTINSIN